jgi:hypothetical protein
LQVFCRFEATTVLGPHRHTAIMKTKPIVPAAKPARETKRQGERRTRTIKVRFGQVRKFSVPIQAWMSGAGAPAGSGKSPAVEFHRFHNI